MACVILRMQKKLTILDFGSQYTQLIARRVRELGVYSEVIPFHQWEKHLDDSHAIILSGSPFSVRDEESPDLNIGAIAEKMPVLGICYGAQLMAQKFGGEVRASDKREYGRAELAIDNVDVLMQGLDVNSQIWMSHGDSIKNLSTDFEIIASSASIPVAAFKAKEGVFPYPVYGIQFHPEVSHTLQGNVLLKNFLKEVAHCEFDWTPASFVEETVERIKNEVGDRHVLMGLSGGVDSTVAARLIQRAIGDRLHSFFIDNGLLRKGEYEEVLDHYKDMGFNVVGIDATDEFLSELEGVKDPEKKRKIIGRVFIEVFEAEAKKIPSIDFLGQGTIYPDVIESISVHGPSVTIKSHHNVGGLPDHLALKLVEPLRMLFKDEVRKVGAELDIPQEILGRHPFPGPGLAIRILGEMSRDKITLLQDADKIYIDILKKRDLYDKIWQAGAILLPVQSVGVMGDERSYEFTLALRAVNSVDGMTAEWSQIPYEVLGEISNAIINQVKGINRVVYDISTKPPATIEWE